MIEKADYITIIARTEVVGMLDRMPVYRDIEIECLGPGDVKEKPRRCAFCGSRNAHAWYVRPILDAEGKMKYSEMVFKCNQIDIVGGRPWSFFDIQTGVKIHVG